MYIPCLEFIYVWSIFKPQDSQCICNICRDQWVCSTALLCSKTNVLLVLLAYDCFLTLPLEISEIWSSRFTAAKLFYFFNRYGNMAYFCINCTLWTLQTENLQVSSFFFFSLRSSSYSQTDVSSALSALHFSDFHIVAQYSMSSKISPSTLLMSASLVSVLNILWAITHRVAGIFTLRTFAIYHNNWVILSVLAIQGFSRVALGLVRIVTLWPHLSMFLLRLHSSVASTTSLLR